MKPIILTALVGLCLSSWAQDFTIPYNPDSDLNGLIGSPDLLSLLAVYGEEFSAAVVSEDSTSAIVYMGDMAFPLCKQSCKDLPGMWEMPLLGDLALVWGEVHTEGAVTRTWLRQNSNRAVQTEEQYFDYFHSGSEDFTSENYHYVSSRRSPISNNRCYCSIQDIPKVEYSFCGGGSPSSLTPCIEEKLAQGWLPLPGFPVSHDQQGYGNWLTGGNTSDRRVPPVIQTHASFWRWAE